MPLKHEKIFFIGRNILASMSENLFAFFTFSWSSTHYLIWNVILCQSINVDKGCADKGLWLQGQLADNQKSGKCYYRYYDKTVSYFFLTINESYCKHKD